MNEPKEYGTYGAEWWEVIPWRSKRMRPPGLGHLSLEEYVAFLEAQLAGAVGTLRQMLDHLLDTKIEH